MNMIDEIANHFMHATMLVDLSTLKMINRIAKNVCHLDLE